MDDTSNTIEIHLRTADQLFNLLDPSPFRDRDLDEKAERYIFGYARELRSKGPFRIIVTLPVEACASPFAQHIPEAIHNYFAYRAGLLRQDLRELLRNGWRFLMIGLVVLAACFAAIRALNLPENPGTLQRLLEQSLLILGWVANWRPIEIFLYEWLPLYRQIKLYDRIAASQTELRPVVATAAPASIQKVT
jgi:hypothetical protein